jgi:hypothetical protein
LVPLIVVAWADGTLDEEERTAILSACELEGIVAGSGGYELLVAWLAANPGDTLLLAWKDFVSVARHYLSSQALEALRADLLGRARKVAQASGGPGGKISAAEQNTLRQLEQAFLGA